MHLLETDASNGALQWSMDSPMVRKTDEKSNMIRTASRIDANLPPHIGNVSVAGSCFTPHCRAFSKVTMGFPLDVEYGRRRRSLPPRPEHRQSPGKKLLQQKGKDEAQRDREVPTSPHSDGNDDRFHASRINKESNLNGFINGFIVQANPDNRRSSPDSHSPSDTSTFRGIKIENNACGNNNSNNNGLPFADSVKYGAKWSNAERENQRNNSEFRSTKEYLEYLQPDNREENIILNGSDILRRMYASFGSRSGDRNAHLESLCDANHQNCHDSEKPRVRSPDEKQRRETNREKVDNKCRAHVTVSNFKLRPTPTSPIHPSCNPKTPTSDDLENRDLPRLQNPRKSREFEHDKLANDCENTSKRREDSSTASEDTTSQTSPPHSIDSLLSKHRNESNIPHETSLRGHRSIHTRDPEKHNSCKRKGARYSERQLNHQSDSESRDQSSQSPKQVRVNERDAYNEKSREIFRQDKEIIENAIRQNSQIPYARYPQETALQSPPWLNSSAMAALQANLLSSFPQNGPGALGDPSLFLKTASLAAAASANPLLLGSNPYLANPYFLRGVGTNEVAAAAAYHQAMAQGLLQSHPSITPLLNSGVMSNPAIYPGLGPFICGLGDASPLTAAIAASLRPSAAALYHNFPYATQPQHTVPVEDNIGPKFGHAGPVTSTNRSTLASKRPSTEAAGKEHSPPKQRRETREIRSNLVVHPAEDTPRLASKEYISTAVRPKILSEKLHISRNSPKPFVPQSPSSAFDHKRKSPPPNSINLSTPKKKPCAARIDTNCDKKSSLKEFSSNSLLKPPKQKNGDCSKAPPISNEKMQGNSEKLLAARPSSYKNLTRERRLVANARERTRVNTISSAFEELRHQIPSYSCNQKLSKLAILRIACSYIQSLSVLSGRSTEGTFTESVDQCTRVLQAESRARSRRKNNKAQIEWEVANYEKAPSYDDEVEGKADVSICTPGTPPSVLHNVATADSPRHDENAQVHGESDYRKAENDSPPFHRDSLGDLAHHPVDTTRSDDSNEPVDQSRHNVMEEKPMAENDSLDSNTEQIKASHVNAADGVDWKCHKHLPRGDNISRNNTWYSNTHEPLDNQNVSLSLNDCDTEKNSEHNGEDRDLINVED